MKKKKELNGVAEETREWRKRLDKSELLDILVTVLSVLFSGVVAAETAEVLIPEISWIKWALFGISCFFFVLLLITLVLKCINFSIRKKAFNYEKAKRIEAIDKSVFTSLNAANAAKVRSTLRFTYGHVHDWNPINYRKNVLVYDVHEQLRTILLTLKQVIIQTSPERFHEDNVTVDLVWCYPKENEYDGYLPYSDGQSFKGKKFPWKLISTVDGSESAHSIQEWLKSKDSFYAAVIQKGYLCSDKNELFGYYHIDTKDKEYNDDLRSILGSVAGVVIDVKNDEPAKVLVRAILTVNTFGANFYDAESMTGFTKAEYEELIKRRIITVYKSLLASELVQMYIRHSLREDGRCSITGSLPEEYLGKEVHAADNCTTENCNPKRCKRLLGELKSFFQN